MKKRTSTLMITKVSVDDVMITSCFMHGIPPACSAESDEGGDDVEEGMSPCVGVENDVMMTSLL